MIDVVVVGAGFSGLTAARALISGGLEVAVVEALPVVGGRTRTTWRDGTWLELGGQWASPRHTELLALADSFGLTTFATPTAGAGLLIKDGHRCDLDDDADAPDVAAAVGQLDALASELSIDSPWAAADAREMDAVRIDEWAESAISRSAVGRRLVGILEELMTVPASELSLLTVLQSARSSGSMAAAIGIEGGAQELRLAGGLHQLAQRMADELGDVVHTDWPVSRIVADELVTVEGARGVLRAKHVVVALAPSMARHVSFSPALPTARETLHRRMPLGSVIKVNVVYERSFWRDQGFSGLVIDHDGPLTYGVDNTSPDQECGVLVSFFAGERARQFSQSGEATRRSAVIDQVTGWFGPEAADPVAYVDHDWTTEPWIGGGYSGVMQPGAWQVCGPALRSAIGPVHWAGSETATEWTGYVEGAIRAGQRAASEVLSEWSRDPRPGSAGTA